jgi:hypothetical protein
MSQRNRLKRTTSLMRGRGVTEAQQTFNLHGEGSNPSGPILFSRSKAAAVVSHQAPPRW